MNLHIPIDIANTVLQKSAEDQYLKLALERNPFKKKVIVDGLCLNRKSVRILSKLAQDEDRPWANDVAFLAASLSGSQAPTFTNMHDLKEGIALFLQSNLIKSYMFRRGAFKSVLPFLVTGLKSDNQVGYSRVQVPHVSFKLLWSTGGSKTVNERTFDFSPSGIGHILESMGIEYEEKVQTVKMGREQPYEVLINVTASKPVRVEDLFHYYELFVETKELHELYEKQIDRYMEFLPNYGKQFRVRGSSMGGRSMLIEGRPARCILTTIPQILIEESSDSSDDAPRRRKARRVSYFEEDDYGGSSFMGNSNSEDDVRFSPEAVAGLTSVTLEDLMVAYTVEETEEQVLVPLHPTLNVFHLELQTFFDVHVNNIALYKYRTDMEEMLILPDNMKRLSRMLVSSSSNDDVMDVVENKSQATIVACIGDPGLGKTLMAEVMSESCQLPLYKIQAAQLGLDVSSLESNLYRILRRAERWGAVIMIDEANAYIHERGHDIHQNAIVGVFLRLLEYFSGILMLTTNQTRESLDDDTSFDIDDAILSRCQAVFKFELPDQEMSTQLWALQAKLMKKELSDKLIQKLVKRYRLSGRSIRNLLRLSSAWAQSLGEPLSMKHFIDCESRIPKTKSEQIANREEMDSE